MRSRPRLATTRSVARLSAYVGSQSLSRCANVETWARQAKVEQAVSDRLNAQNGQAHYRKKLDEDQAKVNEAKAEAEELEKTFKVTSCPPVAITLLRHLQEWVDKAEEYCEKVPNARSVETVDRELKSMQAALREREKKSAPKAF